MRTVKEKTIAALTLYKKLWIEENDGTEERPASSDLMGIMVYFTDNAWNPNDYAHIEAFGVTYNPHLGHVEVKNFADGDGLFSIDLHKWIDDILNVLYKSVSYDDVRNCSLKRSIGTERVVERTVKNEVNNLMLGKIEVYEKIFNEHKNINLTK